MQEMQETLGSMPRLGISPGEGNGNLLQYSCLENSMNRNLEGYGVSKSWTQLSVDTYIQKPMAQETAFQITLGNFYKEAWVSAVVCLLRTKCIRQVWDIFFQG